MGSERCSGICTGGGPTELWEIGIAPALSPGCPALAVKEVCSISVSFLMEEMEFNAWRRASACFCLKSWISLCTNAERSIFFVFFGLTLPVCFDVPADSRLFRVSAIDELLLRPASLFLDMPMKMISGLGLCNQCQK